jgi:hypothetical protein
MDGGVVKGAMTRSGSALAVLAMVGLVAAGCTRTQAKIATVPPPPLDVPAPPPRMVEPVLAELPPSAEAPGGQPAETTGVRPAPPAQPRPPRPEAPRTDGQTAETAPAAESQKPSQAATLQTVPAEKERQIQHSIRVHLDSAIANLNRVDYRILSADGRANFDQTRRFIAQAEDALRTKNFVFAATVADKAATLAAQLAGR